MARLKKEEVLSLDNIMDVLSNEFTKKSLIEKFQKELKRMEGKDLVKFYISFAKLKMDHEKHKLSLDDNKENKNNEDSLKEDAILNLGIVKEVNFKVSKPTKKTEVKNSTSKSQKTA